MNDRNDQAMERQQPTRPIRATTTTRTKQRESGVVSGVGVQGLGLDIFIGRPAGAATIGNNIQQPQQQPPE